MLFTKEINTNIAPKYPILLKLLEKFEKLFRVESTNVFVLENVYNLITVSSLALFY